MAEAAAPQNSRVLDALRSVAQWCRRRPVDALLLAALGLVFWWFYGAYHVFINGRETTLEWMRLSWNPQNDLEHGGIIFPAALFMVWYHRDRLRLAPKSGSSAGLFLALAGVLLFVFSVRTLQPRLAIFALPLLFYGSVRWLWGKETARIILFPCCFLVFMVPIGFLVSRTVGLQTMTATVAAKLASLFGIHVFSDGARLLAQDGSFQFEVAGGCSGIRSLTAMTMLAAIYVHFTQRELWKKGVIFCSSLLFALAGNFVRIFSVVVMAKVVNPGVAGGLYHDYSGFVFFPIAVSTMLAFSRLLNRDWSALPPPDIEVGLAPARSPRPKAAATAASYDY